MNFGDDDPFKSPKNIEFEERATTLINSMQNEVKLFLKELKVKKNQKSFDFNGKFILECCCHEKYLFSI